MKEIKFYYQLPCPDMETRARIRKAIRKISAYKDFDYRWQCVLDLVETEAEKIGIEI